MSIKVKEALKGLAVIIIILLLFFFRIKEQDVTMAILLLMFSFSLFFKVRKDIYLTFLLIPIVYANYSIAVGEFISENLQVSFNTLRFFNYNNYLDVLLMLCIFIVVLFFFLKPINNSYSFKPKDSSLIFYSLTIAALLINIIFFDRSESSSYVVRSNSLHGYTYLIILFMSYYSGNKWFRKFLILSIVAFISLQSLFYGGRQAIIPTVIITLITIFSEKLNSKNVLLVTAAGIVFLTIVGQLRGTADVGFATIIQLFTNDYFVQDTSVYAFNSSVTHVFAQSVYSNMQRISSFVAFLLSIFIGQDSDFTILGNVTLMSDDISNNLGGGMISSYFYFWLGWFGVVLIPFIIVFIINKLNTSSKNLHNLILIGVVATTSTWYLYSPLQFFRIISIFIPLIYIVLKFVDKESRTLKGS